MSIIYEVTRRDFLRTTGIGAGAVVFGCALPAAALAQDAPKQSIVDGLLHGFDVPDIPFVALKFNGDVIIITHRAEMGQGIRTSLAAVLADEMEADWTRVSLRQADADSEKFGIKFPVAIPPDTMLPRPYHRLDPKKPPYIIEGQVAQFTDSSRSMAAYYSPMRLFGTALRLVMERAAAARFGVHVSEVKARQHKVYHEASGRSVDYKKLLLRSQKVTPPTYEEIVKALKKPEEWNFIGKEQPARDVPFYDAKDMVMGKTEYGADIRLHGMLTAMIERCPVANGDVGSYDASETMKVPGVVEVIKVRIPGVLGAGGVGAAFVPHAGVAVLATNTWAAWQGRRKLKVQWDYGYEPAKTNATYDSDQYRQTLDDSARKAAKKVVVRHKGDVDAALSQAADGDRVEECYYVPLLAQTPMEPPVAVALLENGRLEVWAPTQNPDSAQQMAGMAAFGVPIEQWETDTAKARMRKDVTVHLPLLGGGFGRKSKPDYIMEAAFLAAKKPGVPIRVQWTREDDIKFSYYNAVSCQYLKASLGADRLPTALLWRSAFPSIFGTLFPPPERFGFNTTEDDMWKQRRKDFFEGGEYPFASGIERAQGLEDMPFNSVSNVLIENCAADNHIRIGWMRSVANVYHAFALCSFADEMAGKAGNKDPVRYLLDLIGPGRKIETAEFAKQGVKHFNNNEFPAELIKVPVPGGKALPVVPGFPPDTRRLRAVIEEVAEKSGWKDKWGKLPKGRGIGIAAHRSFLTYVALVFDVSLGDDNKLTINEAHVAVDCGIAVNPDRVRAQIEGGINYGLSMALLGEITVKEGEVVQNNFDDYPVLRIDQTSKKVFTYLVRPGAEVLKDYDDQFVPTGVGEPPTPVVAPALANAIFAAGGPRIREIPFRKHIKV
jgi:isoquinoline 1-oxidoreductase subunit beta